MLLYMSKHCRKFWPSASKQLDLHVILNKIPVSRGGVKVLATVFCGFYYLVLDKFLLRIQVLDYCWKMLDFSNTA